MEIPTELDNYIEGCVKSAVDYIKGVQDGSIVVNKWIKKAVDQFMYDKNREDIEFRPDMVEKVFMFFYFISINKNDRYQRFKPLHFQAFIITAIFGLYYRGTEKRKTRYVFLYFARKNGKSVFAAALQLYFLLADGVEDPQSLLLASTRDQAKICLDYAKGIIQHSAALDNRLEAQNYRIIFKDSAKGGFSKVLASQASRLDGYSASAAILDEIHAYKSYDLFNVVKSSTGARKNPMIFLITTAGFELNSFCYDYLLYAKNVLEGEIKDEGLFSAIYSIDEEDDPSNEQCWVKANPALGEIVQIDYLRSEFANSQFSEAQMRNFLTKHLNIFTDSEDALISNDILLASMEDFTEEELYGSDIWIGIDLSATTDLSAIVGVVKKEDKYYIIPKFLMPNNPKAYKRAGGINLLDWINKGFIRLCEKKTLDWDAVEDTLIYFRENFNIKNIAYDPAYSGTLHKIFTDNKLMSKVKAFQQRHMQYNLPTKELLSLFLEDKIRYNSPVLKWNINNTRVDSDQNANWKPSKTKSLESIDGAVAFIMALGVLMETSKIRIDSSLFKN